MDAEGDKERAWANSVVKVDGFAGFAARYPSGGRNSRTTFVTTAERWFGMSVAQTSEAIELYFEEPIRIGERSGEAGQDHRVNGW